MLKFKLEVYRTCAVSLCWNSRVYGTFLSAITLYHSAWLSVSSHWTPSIELSRAVTMVSCGSTYTLPCGTYILTGAPVNCGCWKLPLLIGTGVKTARLFLVSYQPQQITSIVHISQKMLYIDLCLAGDIYSTNTFTSTYTCYFA